MDDIADNIFKAIGLLGAGAGWYIQFRAKFQRELLKLDLEILGMAKTLFGENNDLTRKIAAKTTELMSAAYKHIEPTSTRLLPWADLLLALACFIGAYSFFSSWQEPESSTWQLAGTIITAFIGVGAVLNAYEKIVPRSKA